MLIDLSRRFQDALDRSRSREALERARLALAGESLPLGADLLLFQAVHSSRLRAAIVFDAGGRSLNSLPVPRLEALPGPSAAEYARLISKGRLLYEHCMAEISSVCVLGFMEHEMRKSPSFSRVLADLLAWMVDQRLQLEDLVPEEGEDAVARIAHTDAMIDQGVVFLHGLGREAARELVPGV